MAYVAGVSVGLGCRERPRNGIFFGVLVRGGENRKLLFFLPLPLFPFSAPPPSIFLAALTPKISFLSLWVFSNPTERLAAQATRTITTKYYCNKNTREDKVYLQAIFYINSSKNLKSNPSNEICFGHV